MLFSFPKANDYLFWKCVCIYTYKIYFLFKYRYFFTGARIKMNKADTSSSSDEGPIHLVRPFPWGHCLQLLPPSRLFITFKVLFLLDFGFESYLGLTHHHLWLVRVVRHLPLFFLWWLKKKLGQIWRQREKFSAGAKSMAPAPNFIKEGVTLGVVCLTQGWSLCLS